MYKKIKKYKTLFIVLLIIILISFSAYGYFHTITGEIIMISDNGNLLLDIDNTFFKIVDVSEVYIEHSSSNNYRVGDSITCFCPSSFALLSDPPIIFAKWIIG
jgi:hypothetical protein